MYRSSDEALEGFFASQAIRRHHNLVLSRATLIRTMNATIANPSNLTTEAAHVWEDAVRLAEHWKITGD